jgi:hypothetical protein
MEIICPGHGGSLYVAGNDFIREDGTIKTLVIECPVCDEEVLINGADLEMDGYFTELLKKN